METAAVAVFLAGLALLDGALAGFRASAGRSALIRKRRYNLVAGSHGVCCSALLMAGMAAGLGSYLALSPDAAGGMADLTAAGRRMALVYLPYALIVLASLAGYFVLPLRASSWTILAGLGPLTIARPFVAMAGGLAASWHSTGLVVPIAACAAVAGVLSGEPFVYRRWYRGLPRAPEWVGPGGLDSRPSRSSGAVGST